MYKEAEKSGNSWRLFKARGYFLKPEDTMYVCVGRVRNFLSSVSLQQRFGTGGPVFSSVTGQRFTW